MQSLKACAFLLIFSIVSFAGCATLPDVSGLMAESSTVVETPVIEGSRGVLSPQKGEEIFSRLEGKVGPTDLLQAQARLMETLSGHPLAAGNKATLLVDGPAALAAMSKAIAEAKDHVNVETFLFDDDEVGRKFADLLIRKQSENVQVNLIYDSVGCIHTPARFFKRLKESGIRVVEFNPISPLKAEGKLLTTHRDHRKVVVVDGKVAFTGGVNISSVFSWSPSRSGGGEEGLDFGWRDTHVMIEGPAVAQFQRLFLDTWHQQKGPEFDERGYFPDLAPAGKELVTVIGSTPGKDNRITYVMYVSAVRNSQRSVRLTTAYFVPDRQMLEALLGARRRGVDVQLILPGYSDSTLALYAGRSHYEDLLEAGVRVYERQNRVLHAKTAVIDEVWSTIGSTNLDEWSFLRNNEINAIILGPDFANQMEGLFEKDVAQSHEITREEWSGRPLWTRLKELFARLMSRWL